MATALNVSGGVSSTQAFLKCAGSVFSEKGGGAGEVNGGVNEGEGGGFEERRRVGGGGGHIRAAFATAEQ